MDGAHSNTETGSHPDRPLYGEIVYVKEWKSQILTLLADFAPVEVAGNDHQPAQTYWNTVVGLDSQEG